MCWESPVKSVGLCFFRTGEQTELFFPSDSWEAVLSLASFLESGDAAILSVENSSSRELSVLDVCMTPLANMSRRL